MKARIALGVCLLAAGLPVGASAGGLDVRVGSFWPRASSTLFDDVSDLYLRDGREISASDWRGWAGGVEWTMRLARYVELGIHVDGYARSLQTSDRDFVTESGREIRQTLRFENVPIGFSVRFVPTSRRQTVAPFIAAGADLVYWKYEEFGDFVDFDSFDPRDGSFAIYTDAFISDGVSPGFHVSGGLRVALGDDFALVGEGRYLWASADMGRDFRGSKLDLSGAWATLGLHIRF
jgi:hypothetical protein